MLENKVVGLLAHEAIGHCSEADNVKKGSFLADKIGKKVASDKITLLDDGSFPQGFGTMKYDDEGVPTRKVVIIEDGVLRNYLHSLSTAPEFGVNSTGNARAWNFEHEPIVRMRNTYIKPGRYTFEEVVEDITEGYFLKGWLGGQAALTGEFMIGVQEVQKIENGELTESFRGTTISGNIFDVLTKVEAVGKDFIMCPGLCIKEQSNYVGMGAQASEQKFYLGEAKLGILNYAEQAIKKCEKLGADEAEAFVQSRRTVEAFIKERGIRNIKERNHLGLSIRLIKKRKLGFAYSSFFGDKSKIEHTCENALKLANTSVPNREWGSLPTPKKCHRTPYGILDKEIENLKIEEVFKMVMRVQETVAANFCPRVSVSDGELLISITENTIANSHGINVSQKTSLISLGVICMVKNHKTISGFGYEYFISRTLKDLPLEETTEKAAEKSLFSLNSEKIDSFLGQVILDCDPAATVLFSPLISSVNSENVQRGRSLWRGMINEAVANSKLSIVDDGLFPFGIGSSSFDDEGVPRQRTILLENGVLKEFLYNSFTANKEGSASTGNAGREDYTKLPSISVSNLIIKSGKKALQELISEVDKGVIVRGFSGNVRAKSGEFSGVIKGAGYIENGEIKFSLRDVMMSDNAFEALRNIVEIGSERKPTKLYVYTPPIMVEGVKILANTFKS